ncbi:hypothetical protein BRC97_06045, partial [Halobacteriales archaeon QS_6_71_20]
VAARLLFAQPRFVHAVGAVALAAVAVDLAGRVPADRLPDARIADGPFPWSAVVGRSDAPDGVGGSDRSDGVSGSDASDGSAETVGVAGPDGRAALAAATLLVATAGGGAALGYGTTLGGDASTPEFIDGDDREAMAWIAAETPPGATFVAVGDAAEWLPALTDRTLLIGPWGVEWRDARAYRRQLASFRALSTCERAACVERVAGAANASPTHVYVPRGRYTVRGETTTGGGRLVRSFARADGWTRVYENDGVVVYRSTRADA